jgi:hypothetical protein
MSGDTRWCLTERNDAGMTAVMNTAAISPIADRKYLKTAKGSVGLQDAQASEAWLTLSTRRSVATLVVRTNTNGADLNKPRYTKSYKRIGPRILTASPITATLHPRYKNLIFPHRSSVNVY